MIYRFLLKQFKRDYPVCRDLSNLLRYALKFGVKSVAKDGDLVLISFNNGMRMEFVDVDRYNGWIRCGFITNKLGPVYSWYDKMPSAGVLYKIRSIVDGR